MQETGWTAGDEFRAAKKLAEHFLRDGKRGREHDALASEATREEVLASAFLKFAVPPSAGDRDEMLTIAKRICVGQGGQISDFIDALIDSGFSRKP